MHWTYSSVRFNLFLATDFKFEEAAKKGRTTMRKTAIVTGASRGIGRADALLLMIGATANTSWLPPALERDAKGYIYTGRDLTAWPLDREPFPLETSLPGVFCAGDVRHGSIKRLASGVGEGSMSIAFIHQYLALTGGLILPAFEIPRPFGLRRAKREKGRGALHQSPRQTLLWAVPPRSIKSQILSNFTKYPAPSTRVVRRQSDGKIALHHRAAALNGIAALPFVIPSAAEGSAVLRTCPGKEVESQRHRGVGG
jgi:hypothetical protein